MSFTNPKITLQCIHYLLSHFSNKFNKQQVLEGIEKLTLLKNENGQYMHDAILLFQSSANATPRKFKFSANEEIDTNTKYTDLHSTQNNIRDSKVLGIY